MGSNKISSLIFLLVMSSVSFNLCAVLKSPISSTKSPDYLLLSPVNNSKLSDTNEKRPVSDERKFQCKNFLHSHSFATREQKGGSVNYSVIRNCSQMKGDSFAVKLTKDGYLHVENKSEFLAPGKFCIDSQNSRVARQCPTNSPFHSTVWRKCCPEHQMLSLTTSRTCINSFPSLFRPKIDGELQSFAVLNSTLNDFTCPKGYYLRRLSTNICATRSMTSKAKATTLTLIWNALSLSETDDDDTHNHDETHIGTECNCRFQLSPNGSILYEVATGVFLRRSHWKTLDPSHDLYCIDGVKNPVSACGPNKSKRSPHRQQNVNNKNRSGPGAAAYHSSVSNNILEGQDSDCDYNGKGNNKNSFQMASVLYICIQEDSSADYIYSESITAKTTVLAVIWLLTCPLLFGAALGNCCMIQKNVHGWILTCYLLSMCVLNVLSAIVILNVGSENEQEQNKGESGKEKGCSAIDFMSKFTYMSTLCWMTSINFGLWKTFRCTLPRPVGLRRFIASVVFSLGFPAISVTVSYYAAYLGTHQTCKMEYCLLFSYNTIPFYTVPKILLILGNFAIFVKTTHTITRLRKEADEVLRRQATKDHLESFGLFAKLFLLTGAIWILRLVLFILQLQGLYLSWYGIILEMGFSVPEVVFPMIIFHHPEFIKWIWNRSPRVAGFILKVNPFFSTETTSTK